jgi:hypothetical protein
LSNVFTIGSRNGLAFMVIRRFIKAPAWGYSMVVMVVK